MDQVKFVEGTLEKIQGFPQVLRTLGWGGGEGGSSQYMGGAWGA